MSGLDTLFEVNFFTKGTVETAALGLLRRDYDTRMVKSIERAEEVHGYTTTEGVNVVIMLAGRDVQTVIDRVVSDGYVINKIENAELGS